MKFICLYFQSMIYQIQGKSIYFHMNGLYAYLLKAGAILLVRVPATTMTSDCLGLGLKISPNRSISYLAAATCIISTAQQARPKVMGQMDPLLAQFIRSSTFVIAYSATFDNPVAGVAGGLDPPYLTGELDSDDDDE